MVKSQEYILVLLSEHYEELVATILTTILREAGLRVKVVGITAKKIRGRHGMVIVPDLTLDQAVRLAPRVQGIVMPCDVDGLRLVRNDPRLSSLFLSATGNHALFILGEHNLEALHTLNLFPASATFAPYPEQEDLLNFAHDIADRMDKPRGSKTLTTDVLQKDPPVA
jgi:hypothetical protein